MPRSGERGSAYIVALMALLVLTLGGLSVALITQTEMQVGVNERLQVRDFYAAESGLAIATGDVLNYGGACRPPKIRGGVATDLESLDGYVLDGWQLYVGGDNEESSTASSLGADMAFVSPALVLMKSCCNLCPCQVDRSDRIGRMYYGLISEGQRLAWSRRGSFSPGTDSVLPDDEDMTLVGSHVLGTLMDVSPLDPSGVPLSCMQMSPEILAKYKF